MSVSGDKTNPISFSFISLLVKLIFDSRRIYFIADSKLPKGKLLRVVPPFLENAGAGEEKGPRDS